MGEKTGLQLLHYFKWGGGGGGGAKSLTNLVTMLLVSDIFNRYMM